MIGNEKLWEEGGELYMSRKIYTNTEDGKKQLLGILSLLLPELTLGILVHLISGFRPSVRTQDNDNPSTEPIWLQRKRKRPS